MKTKWRIISGIILLVLAIYTLAKIDFTETYEILKTLNPLYFLLAFSMQIIWFMVFAFRGTFYLKPLFEPEFWFLLKVTFAGGFINVITPGTNVGGEPVKAYYLGKKYKKPKSKVFGGILADRIVHGAVGLFFVMASLLFILAYIPISRELKTIFIALLLFVISIFVIFFLLNTKRKKFDISKIIGRFGVGDIKNKKLIKHIGEGLGNFSTYFRRTIFDKKILPYGLFLSAVCFVLYFLSSYFLFLSLDFHVGFFIVLMVVSLGTLIGDISPTPGGVGLVEGFMIFLYSILGVNIGAAIIVSVLSRLISYFNNLVIGGIMLFYLEKELG